MGKRGGDWFIFGRVLFLRLWTRNEVSCAVDRLTNARLWLLPAQTEHDFNLEKQMLVHNARLRIQEEFTQKIKDFDVQQRVARSVAIGEARVQRMQHRDTLLQELRETTSQRLAAVANTPQYSTLLKQLIVQGLLRIQEPVVSIRCRQTDLPKVKQVLPEAVAEYTKLMKDAGHNVNPNVSVDETGENYLNEKRWCVSFLPPQQQSVAWLC